MKIQLKASSVNDKWIIWKDDADLSEYEPDKIQTWKFECKKPDFKSNVKTGEKLGSIKVENPAYALAYKAAWLKVHCTKISGENVESHYLSDEPSDELIDSLNDKIIHTAYDKAFGLTDDEVNSLMKKKE